MRLLVSTVLFLSIFASIAQAQTAADNDGRRAVSIRSRFALSDIDEKMVKEFDLAWQQCVLGTRDTEAVVLVLRNPEGNIKAVSGGRSNQAYQFTFKWNRDIIAIVHTHPNNRDPKPQPQDILVARKFDVPIFTLTRRGMYVYDPAADRITMVKRGVEWLDSSSWVTHTQLAAADQSNR